LEKLLQAITKMNESNEARHQQLMLALSGEKGQVERSPRARPKVNRINWLKDMKMAKEKSDAIKVHYTNIRKEQQF
jgi:hypothetical protein